MAVNYIWYKYKAEPNITISTQKEDIGPLYRDYISPGGGDKNRAIYYLPYESVKPDESWPGYLEGVGEVRVPKSYGGNFPVNPKNYYFVQSGGYGVYTNLEYYGRTTDNFDCYYGYRVILNTDNPYKSGSYVGQVKSSSRSAYPDDGEKDGYYYEYKGTDNQAPTISGNNLDLGSKQEDFEIEYIVKDYDNDTCTVDITVDGVKRVSNKSVVLNTKYTYQVKIDDFTLGKHTISIVAKDSKGSSSSTRTYTFTKRNLAPIISGTDIDLGERSTAFTEEYSVTDKNNDDIDITVTLDDIEISNISSAQNKALSFTITNEQLQEFEIGSRHTVTIKADDGKGGVAYRRYTFTKANRPPIINGADSDLGEKKESFDLKYSFTDVENDKIYSRVYLDGKMVVEDLEVVDSEEYTYKTPTIDFLQLRYGKHEIKIEAWDDYSVDNKQARIYTFERISNGLEVEIKINEFDIQPNKIIAVPHGIFASDADMQVFACNNYNDTTPTWEDMTESSKAARAYAFTNTTKTNAKWSIGIRITVENGESGVASVLRGVKGGYE